MSLPDATVNKNLQGHGVRASVQRFGGFLAGMIMPNIGAFIAWGLLTALFIETGWAPNATLAKLVDPTLTYLLPVLIGYTGGKIVNGTRGGVIGAIATMGVIVGADITMFLGAMVMGPFAAWLLKHVDKLLKGRVRSGFEMLVDNFEIGILGMVLAIIGHMGVEPVVSTLMGWLAAGVGFLVHHGLLPLASVLVEPAKVLFLNNAVNHGIFTPLGTQEAHTTGRSILFMVESNPGPGLGLLLAYQFFGSRQIRQSTPGAIIIHLFGGIHEIFFPYVLMKPKTILATIAGAMSGLAVGVALHAGLVAPASPGSIIAWFLMCQPGHYMAMIADFLTATVVSFIVAMLLIRKDRDKDDAATGTKPATRATATSVEAPLTDIREVIIACDAGMGSSVMVASAMKKRLSPYGIGVTHTAIDQIPPDASLILTQQGLVDRAHKRAPGARIVGFTNYMNDPAFDRVEADIRAAHGASAPVADVELPHTSTAKRSSTTHVATSVLPRDAIRLGQHAVSKEEAIIMAGQVLIDEGAADDVYVKGMLARENQISTYMGAGVAIPHGINEVRDHISKATLGFLQFPEGVEWDGNTCTVVIPIASSSDEHLEIMATLARILSNADTARQLREATSADEVLRLLSSQQA
ncbi:PTS mannitol transporter subunit IICBA [Cutibacterium porci]|uniref:PTS mannitol transporter subunit IICBA n=1 Tax=Cutibacterium porci TaxID=2605781 RepID=UPI0018A6D19E|nr:PTS mannitol transporter subunit IICBA [Cutibacterium porci]